MSASSGQSEKNMIVTDELGTSEVHRDGFEMSACQVLVWDSRSVVETSQLERHIPMASFFKRTVIPVSIVKLIEGSNIQYSFAVHG